MSSRRYHDDEALLLYLHTDRSDTAWQVVYDHYRRPIYAYYRAKAYEDARIKRLLVSAFAELLEDARSNKIPLPLPISLLEMLLTFMHRKDNLQDRPAELKLPADATYLAKKVLVELIRQPDREAVSRALYDSFREPAFGIMRSRYALAETELEDLFQEAMLGLLKRPPKDKAGQSAKLFTYFMYILRNKALDLLKARNKQAVPSDDLEQFERLADQLPAAESHKNATFWDYVNETHALGERFAADEAAELIDQLFERISAKCSNLLKLRYIEEKKFKEIAAIIGCNVNDVGQRVKRCLQQMRSELQQVSKP